MYESRSFVYLDLQKTGTNFIIDFLRRFSTEGRGRRRKHKPARPDPHGEKICFISVRDPLDQYVSLYSFGCDGNGEIFKRLNKKGRADLYQRSTSGFCHWLEFMLDPDNAPLFDMDYAKAAAGHLPALLGYQSCRFLNLAFNDPVKVFDDCRTKQDIVDAYSTRSIISATIRYSHFKTDLKSFVENHLRDAISDMEGALKFLDDAPALNKSGRIDRDESLNIDDSVYAKLHAREWLYYEGFVKI